VILRVWRYAYGGAKVMALRSWLLNPEDYHFLFQAQNLADFFKYLETTVYGAALKGWDWQAPDAEAEFNRRLYGELARSFRKVGRGLKKREGLFIRRLVGRLEAENLKLVLRALHQGLPSDPAVRLLIPLTGLSPLNFAELVNQGTIKALVDYLAPTTWGPPLTRGLPRYLRELSLFPLEMSLDIWVFDYLRQGLAHLSKADRDLAGHLLDTLAEITNLIWVARFRELFGLPGEEVYQYLPAAGIFREPSRRQYLAFSENLTQVTERLPRRPYGEVLAGATKIAAAEERLGRYWVRNLERILGRAPFQIGLPIAYLFLKELEIRNLITLMTGILLRAPANLLKSHLQGWAAEGTHV